MREGQDLGGCVLSVSLQFKQVLCRFKTMFGVDRALVPLFGRTGVG